MNIPFVTLASHGGYGRFDSDGYLWYVGRRAEKELIKPGGEKVYPGRSRKGNFRHPMVAAASVIGFLTPNGVKRLRRYAY